MIVLHRRGLVPQDVTYGAAISPLDMSKHAHAKLPKYRICNFYVHARIHTYIHTHIHTYIHTYMHACMHAYIHTYIHTHIHVQILLRTYMRTIFQLQVS